MKIIGLIRSIGLFCIMSLQIGIHCHAQESKSVPNRRTRLGPVDSLVGWTSCPKLGRVAFYWANGEFELWDTGGGKRIGEVRRLPSPVEWCATSKNENVIVTADRMPNPTRGPDLERWQAELVPSLRIWNAETGAKMHEIEMREASPSRYHFSEWTGDWLSDSKLLVVRKLRTNAARTAEFIKFIVVDVNAGKVIKASSDYRFIGDHVILSPDKKLILTKADNFVGRRKNEAPVEVVWRDSYARCHVIASDTLAIVSSWQEPRDPKKPDTERPVAYLAHWLPNSKAVVTVDNRWEGNHPSPRIHLWDARKGELLRTFAGHQDYILDLTVTSDSKRFVTASMDNTLVSWDINSGTRTVLSGHTAAVNKVVILPGEKLAVSAAEDLTAKVWELSTGKMQFDLTGHDSAVRALEIVSATEIRSVTHCDTSTTWNWTTGKKVHMAPRQSDFPKWFGKCELERVGDMLEMRVTIP